MALSRHIRTGRVLCALLIIALYGLFAAPRPARATVLDAKALSAAVQASKNAQGKDAGDYELVDQDGVKFHLKDYFGHDGKPLVVSFIYTSCAMVCPTITAELKKAVDGARERFGNKFNVLSIGFDTDHDTTASLKAYGSRFTKDFSRFRFASGDKATIERLTKRFGFFYVKKDDGSYAHMDMATTVRPDGTIYRQVYSIRTRPEKLIERLDEMITGKPESGPGASLVSRLTYFCYKFDPATGKYTVDYSVFGGVIIGIVCMSGVILFVWGDRISARYKKR